MHDEQLNRQALRFADALRLYMMVNYSPDIRACLRVLDDFSTLSDRLGNLERRVQKFTRRDLSPGAPQTAAVVASVNEGELTKAEVKEDNAESLKEFVPQSAEEEGYPSEQSEPRSVDEETDQAERIEPRSVEQRRNQWVRWATLANWIGQDAALVPLLKLRRDAKVAASVEQLTLADDVRTRVSGIDIQDKSRRIVVRWFRPLGESGEVDARILARGLELDNRLILGKLDGLKIGTQRQFLWRHSSREDSTHLFLRGTFGYADIRIAGSGDGLIDLEIATKDRSEADEILSGIVNAIVLAAPLVPERRCRARCPPENSGITNQLTQALS